MRQRAMDLNPWLPLEGLASTHGPHAGPTKLNSVLLLWEPSYQLCDCNVTDGTGGKTSWLLHSCVWVRVKCAAKSYNIMPHLFHIVREVHPDLPSTQCDALGALDWSRSWSNRIIHHHELRSRNDIEIGAKTTATSHADSDNPKNTHTVGHVWYVWI